MYSARENHAGSWGGGLAQKLNSRSGSSRLLGRSLNKLNFLGFFEALPGIGSACRCGALGTVSRRIRRVILCSKWCRNVMELFLFYPLGCNHSTYLFVRLRSSLLIPTCAGHQTSGNCCIQGQMRAATHWISPYLCSEYARIPWLKP